MGMAMDCNDGGRNNLLVLVEETVMENTDRYLELLVSEAEKVGAKLVFDQEKYVTSFTHISKRGLYTVHTVKPKTLCDLFVAFHELGHVVDHDPGNGKFYHNPFHAECAASHWAYKRFQALGLIIPPAIWAEARKQWQADEAEQLLQGRHP